MILPNRSSVPGKKKRRKNFREGYKFFKKFNKALPPPLAIGIKKKTVHVMTFICFISDSQLVDMSGQGWGGVRGVIIEGKKLS